MKFKIVRTFANADITDPTEKFEEKVNEALQQGWKLYGNVIAIPHVYCKGNFIEIYQPMVFEDEE